MKLALQTKKYVGAHVSMSNGIENSIDNIVKIGGTSFALFLKNQRQWASRALNAEEISNFRSLLKKYNFPANKILPHGTYLMNLGNPDPEKLQKSREVFYDDLEKCEQLGMTLYNFHPGSTIGECSIEESIKKIAESINLAHQKFLNVICVLENMSRQGNTIGGDFDELKQIINGVENKARVGVCLDTCHLFAAGYDVSTKEGFENVISNFDKQVGLKYLKAMHINDSKSELSSHLDRHENLGKGKIGWDCFRFIMNDQRFNDIPLILETPCGDESDGTYVREIKDLYQLVNPEATSSSNLSFNMSAEKVVISEGEEEGNSISTIINQVEVSKIKKKTSKIKSKRTTTEESKVEINEKEETKQKRGKKGKRENKEQD